MIADFAHTPKSLKGCFSFAIRYIHTYIASLTVPEQLKLFH